MPLHLDRSKGSWCVFGVGVMVNKMSSTSLAWRPGPAVQFMIHRSRIWHKLDWEEGKSLKEITSKSHSICTGLFHTYSAYSQLHNYNFLRSELGTLGFFCGEKKRQVETVHHIFHSHDRRPNSQLLNYIKSNYN